MTQSQPEMTPEQRLRQTEILLNTAAKRINENTEQIQRNSEPIERLDQAVTQLVELFAQSMAVIRQMQERFDVIAAEVRGLQRENRRIIERVFREDNPET